MVNDTLPITDPRPFYASPYEKLPKSLEYNDFRSAYFPDIKRPDYNTTLQLQWTNIFTHINEIDPANVLELPHARSILFVKLDNLKTQVLHILLFFENLHRFRKNISS